MSAQLRPSSPAPAKSNHALIAIDGCFDICMLSYTAIMLRSVFYLPICVGYFLSKMAIICIWVRKLVFGATPITQYSCPHCDWWLFDISPLSWTAINLRSEFYLPICASYFLSKMVIICIWVRKLFLVPHPSQTIHALNIPLALIN
jgi:hypothetical protein